MHLQDVVYSLRQFGELIKTERRNLFNRTNDTIFENRTKPKYLQTHFRIWLFIQLSAENLTDSVDAASLCFF